MKTSVLLLSLVSFAAIQVAAQAAPHSNFASPSSNQNSATASQSSASPDNDLRGCLSGSKDNYTLVDHQNKAHKVTGDNHLLRDDVGHEVDITGKAGAHNVFEEAEISDIASRCWNFSLK